MDKSVNQQQTLYRFVSIRPPQLFANEGQTIRFVFGGQDSPFYEAVINRPPGQTKSEALKLFAETFGSDPLNELKMSFPSYIIAEWVSSNKSDVTPEQLFNRVKNVSLLLDSSVTELWDNLFYQVVTQENFYSKELVMQVLILNNIVEEFKKLPNDTERIAHVKALASARVVLPPEMFDDDGEEEPQAMSLEAKEVLFSSKKLDRQQDVAMAKYLIERNNEAVAELRKMYTKYTEIYEHEYSAASRDFDEQTRIAYENATIIEKERILCPSNCPEIYYVYENLHLPTFNFNPPQETSPDQLKQFLSRESYYVVESLKLTEAKKIDTIIAGIEASTEKYTKQLYENLDTGSKTIVIGGMAFKENSLASSGSPEFLSELQIPFSANFQYTQALPPYGRVFITLDMGYPNADVVKALYTAHFDSSDNTNGTFTDTTSGNALNLILFSDNLGLSIPSGNSEFTLEATLTLSNGTVIELSCVIPSRGKVSGVANIVSQVSQNTTSDAFVPKKFGIRRLGIADYKKVVSEVCCYREAEVSHIENILQGEFKSKTTTRERIEETTSTTESEYEKENLTDTTTNERFEMQTEVSKLLAQDKQMGAFANLHGNYNHISFETGTNYASSTAKEESNRQAITQGKEITQRASERITSRFREELVRKVTERFKEENSHIFDNRTGTGNVSGVYRYINAVYKNQIYNYGKRLIYEFMIPQPGKLYRMGITVKTDDLPSSPNKREIPKPVDPMTLGVENPSDITLINYLEIAGRYRAQVDAPPAQKLYFGKSYSGAGNNGSSTASFNDLKIPEGYMVSKVEFNYAHRRTNNNNTSVQAIVGTEKYNIPIVPTLGPGGSIMFNGEYNVSQERRYSLEYIPVSIIGWDLGAFIITVNVTVIVTTEKYQSWQAKTFDTIMGAYNDLLDAYYGSLTETQQAGETLLASNPLFYRDIENSTLRRLCISYMMDEAKMGTSYYQGDNFTTFRITQNQDMENYASHVKFMEQAFEWNIMSYNFYPYYWGNRDNWLEMFQSENDDPTFRSFLQSGMARVFVTVRPGFEHAVMHYMRFGQIWNGGQVPIIGDPMYLSIVDELAEQEYIVEETWESVAPTSLTALQKSGVAIDVEGLPCGGGCETDEDNPLKPDHNKLEPVILPPVNP